jgi:hypothetical protein
MNRLCRILKVFAAVWAVLITLSFAAGALSVWLSDGFLAMLRAFNPVDMTNAMIIAFSYAPALIAYILADVLLPSDQS